MKDTVELLQELLVEVRTLRQEVAELRSERAPVRSGEPEPDWPVKSFYTYSEAAAILNVSERTVERWVSSRVVLTINVGGPRIPHDELVRVWRKGVKRSRRKRRARM